MIRCFLTSAFVLVVACRPPVRIDHFAFGIEAASHRRYEQCYLELEHVHTDHSEYQRARFEMGQCRWQLGDQPRGLALMIEAYRIDPTKLGSVQDLAVAVGIAGTRWTAVVPDVPREVYAAGSTIIAVTERGDLIALPSDGGSVIWRAPLGSRREAVSPAFDARRVYAIRRNASTATLLAVDLATGERAWEVDLGVDHDRATAAVADDAVFVGARGQALAAFDASSGKARWTTTLAGQPGATVIAGHDVCTMTSHGNIACLARTTGEATWSYDAGRTASGSSLVARDDKLYYVDRKTIYALEIGTSSARWQRSFDAELSAPSLLSERATLVISTWSAVMALVADTGSDAWTATLPVFARLGPHPYPPAVTPEYIAVAGASTAITLLRPSDGALISIAALATEPTAAPAIVGDTIVTGVGSSVIAVTPEPW